MILPLRQSVIASSPNWAREFSKEALDRSSGLQMVKRLNRCLRNFHWMNRLPFA